MAAESQVQKNLQFGGFYNPEKIVEQKSENSETHRSIKGEAEDSFDFPLQLDFLNSQDKHDDQTFGNETTPYFAPKARKSVKLEKIHEREEDSRNTGSLPTDDLMALLQMSKEE